MNKWRNFLRLSIFCIIIMLFCNFQSNSCPDEEEDLNYNKMNPQNSMVYYPSSNGYILNWLLVGPFDCGSSYDNSYTNNLRNHINTSLSYSTGDPATPETIPISGSDISKIWTQHIDPNSDGTIDLDTYYNDGTDDNHVAAYAQIYIYFPYDAPNVNFVYTSDDGSRVYFDGLLMNNLHGGSSSSTVAFGSISCGWHRLLLLCEDNTGDWRFSARFTYESGTNVNDLWGLVLAYDLSETQLYYPNSNNFPTYFPDSEGYLQHWITAGYFECGGTYSSSATNGGNHIDPTLAYRIGDYAVPDQNNIAGSDPMKKWVPQAISTLDFDSIYGGNHRAAYAQIYVYCPTEVSTVWAHYDCDDGTRIFVDGILQHNRHENAAVVSADIGTFLQGWHRILVLCEDGEGEWNIKMRLSSSESPYTAISGLLESYCPYNGTTGDFLRDWQIGGPYLENSEDIDTYCTRTTDFIDPKQNIDRDFNTQTLENATYGDSLQKWKYISSSTDYIDFIGNDFNFTVTDYHAIYAFTYLYVAEPVTQAYLFYGADDGSRVWLDDTIICQYHYTQGATEDEYKIPLGFMDVGWHRLLILIENDYGGWGFYARFSANELVYQPLPQIQSVADRGSFISDWLVTGPFDEGTNWESYATIGGNHVNATKTYVVGDNSTAEDTPIPGSNSSILWKHISTDTGILDFKTDCQFLTTDYSAAYALTNVYFPTTISSAFLQLGADDGYRIFFDGIEIEDRHEQSIFYIDNYTIPLGSVTSGWHRLMIMCENFDEDWRIIARISATVDKFIEIPQLTFSVSLTNITIAGDTSVQYEYDMTSTHEVSWTVTPGPIQEVPVKITLPTPIAHYSFDSSSSPTQDISGNNNDATFGNGAGRIVDTERGAIANLDGTDDRIGVPALDSSLNQLTITMWVWFNAIPVEQAGLYLTNTWSEIDESIHLDIREGNRITFNGYGLTQTQSVKVITSSDLNKWWHIAVVYTQSAKTVEYYLNGIKDSRHVLSTTDTLSFGAANLGAYDGTNDRSLNGKLDDVRFYSTALNCSQILEIYTQHVAFLFDNPADLLEEENAHSFTIGGSDYSSTIDSERGNVVELTSINGRIEITPMLPLSSRWTISLWFNGIALTPERNTLVSGTTDKHIMILRSTMELGTMNTKDNQFYGSGFIMSGLSSSWHHIAAVGMNSMTFFYIDGQYVGKCNYQSNASITTIGGDPSEQFCNYFDDFHFIPEELTPTEINMVRFGGMHNGSEDHGYYRIWNSSILLSEGLWDAEPLTQSIFGYFPGIYHLTLEASTAEGLIRNFTTSITIQNLLPTVQVPTNFTKTYGESGPILNWNISDNSVYSPSYELYRNGTFVESKSWISGTNVTYSIPTLLNAGLYNFTIIITDGFNSTIGDPVWVSINSLPLSITAPGPVNQMYNSNGTKLNWLISGITLEVDLPYTISCNSILVDSGIWHLGDNITYIIPTSISVGTYSYEMKIFNGDHNFTSEITSVNILNGNPVIQSPQSFIMNFGSYGTILEWTVTDSSTTDDRAYWLYKNGTLVTEGQWNTGSSIIYVIPSESSVGSWNYTLVVSDGYITLNAKNVWVNIIDPNPPSTSSSNTNTNTSSQSPKLSKEAILGIIGVVIGTVIIAGVGIRIKKVRRNSLLFAQFEKPISTGHKINKSSEINTIERIDSIKKKTDSWGDVASELQIKTTDKINPNELFEDQKHPTSTLIQNDTKMDSKIPTTASTPITAPTPREHTNPTPPIKPEPSVTPILNETSDKILPKKPKIDPKDIITEDELFK